MIGLDTNVLLRFYLRDDPVQSPQARRIVESLSAGKPGWVGLANILEFVWVMKSKQRATRDEIARTLELLLTDDEIVMEQPAVVAKAVACFRTTKADFADCLIAESARAAGCSRILTFDEIAARDLGLERIA